MAKKITGIIRKQCKKTETKKWCRACCVVTAMSEAGLDLGTFVFNMLESVVVAGGTGGSMTALGIADAILAHADFIDSCEDLSKKHECCLKKCNGKK